MVIFQPQAVNVLRDRYCLSLFVLRQPTDATECWMLLHVGNAGYIALSHEWRLLHFL